MMTTVLDTIAIDDEPISLQIMSVMAEKLPFLNLTHRFTNGTAALEWLLAGGRADLLLLDIKMPDLSGIDLLERLPEPLMTIFTTGYTEHAVRSFELNAIDYLLKPFTFQRFSQACSKALEMYELRKKAGQLEMEDGVIHLRSGTITERLHLPDLLYAQSAGNYVQFIFTDRKALFRIQISQVEKMLPSPTFVRIHRSCVVNRRWIRRYDRNMVWLIDGTELPVSAMYWQLLHGDPPPGKSQ